MNRHHPLIPLLALAFSCVSASAQSLRGAWIVCTRDLELRETLIDQFNERELVLRNEYGIRSRVPIREVLFVVRNEQTPLIEPDEIAGAPAPEPSPVRLITLSDGQIVRGSIIEPDSPDELAISLIAGRNIHGEAHIPLDRVLRINDQDTDRTLGTRNDELDDDLIITRNGDRIVGFIESLGPTTSIAQQRGGTLDLETTRIESILIANQLEPERGVYMSFTDREMLRASMIHYEAQQPITIEVDATSMGLNDTGNSIWLFDAGSLESLIVIDPEARVLALSDLTPRSIEPTGDRDWAPAPTAFDLGVAHPALRGIDLHSPVRVTYALPEGASRFAASFETPIEQWTDCVVRVIGASASGTQVLFEQRFNRETPTAELNAPIPSSVEELVIEIDPGEYGPIQDRVLLHHPRLLIED
ncbi:MAG: hypothetical protein ACF8MF_09585 [Phycisphaerales bacterium JB052]